MRGAAVGTSSVALFLLIGCQTAAGAPVPVVEPSIATPGQRVAPPEEDDLNHPQGDEAIRASPAPGGIPTPVVHVRMHAIVTSNDDGSEPAGATAEGIIKAVKTTNAYYEAAGIVVDFDPRTDFEYRRGTLLNYDCTLDAAAGFAPAGGKPGCDTGPNSAARTSVAAAYPHKMVVWFRSFNEKVMYDDATGRWRPSRATGGYSGSKMPFVVVGPGSSGGTYLAHEVGHYLHLEHTFRRAPDVRGAAEMIRKYVEEGGHPVQQGLQVFDGDANSVSDTPPDAAGSIYVSLGLDTCGPQNDIPIPVTFSNGARYVYTLSPNRHNIMSYFKQCNFYHDFSAQQIARMRDALLRGNRRQVARFDP